MKIKGQITVGEILNDFEVSSCFSSPAIGINKDGTSFIRTVRSCSYNNRTGQRNTSYEYFEMDKEGVIISTPRGYSKEYKGYQVIDIKDRATPTGI